MVETLQTPVAVRPEPDAGASRPVRLLALAGREAPWSRARRHSRTRRGSWRRSGVA